MELERFIDQIGKSFLEISSVHFTKPGLWKNGEKKDIIGGKSHIKFHLMFAKCRRPVPANMWRKDSLVLREQNFFGIY